MSILNFEVFHLIFLSISIFQASFIGCFFFWVWRGGGGGGRGGGRRGGTNVNSAPNSIYIWEKEQRLLFLSFSTNALNKHVCRAVVEKTRTIDVVGHTETWGGESRTWRVGCLYINGHEGQYSHCRLVQVLSWGF